MSRLPLRRRPLLAARASALLLPLVLLATSCSDDGGDTGGRATTTTGAATTDDGTATTTADGPTTTVAEAQRLPVPRLDALPKVKLTKVGTFDEPLDVVPDRDGRMWVVEKSGRLVALEGRTVALDIRDQVSSGSEQGLLGADFHADGTKLYVSYTDRDGDSRLVEYGFDGSRADPGSRRELLSVDQPFQNHNGGHIRFGPDKHLYVALGDGGSAGDPRGNAQNLGTLLGKLLRIDPTPVGDRQYLVPEDNPFRTRAGARAEIWAYGLRNPWRFSFDRLTGDLWIADVGQGKREEVNRAPAASKGGENYGWDRLEGTARFEGDAPAGAVAPVHDYGRDDGDCSVTGGFVYRGSRIKGLAGAYLFGDFCNPQVRVLVPTDDASAAAAPGGNRFEAGELGIELDGLAGFGEDADGELYLVSLEGEVARLDPA